MTIPSRKECRECGDPFLTRDEEERCCPSCRAAADAADLKFNAFHEEGVR